jgi:hypothetical protein
LTATDVRPTHPRCKTPSWRAGETTPTYSATLASSLDAEQQHIVRDAAVAGDLADRRPHGLHVLAEMGLRHGVTPGSTEIEPTTNELPAAMS